MTSEPKSDQAVQPGRQRPPRRGTQVGVVTSTARQKTIRVTVAYSVRHAKYGKFLRRETSLQAHDERSEARSGDVVEVMHCRPLSKTKCWRLVRIVKRAQKPGADLATPTAAEAPRPEVQP
jgi:small subunit ribosomal protein S17